MIKTWYMKFIKKLWKKKSQKTIETIAINKPKKGWFG